VSLLIPAQDRFSSKAFGIYGGKAGQAGEEVELEGTSSTFRSRDHLDPRCWPGRSPLFVERKFTFSSLLLQLVELLCSVMVMR